MGTYTDWELKSQKISVAPVILQPIFLTCVSLRYNSRR